MLLRQKLSLFIITVTLVFAAVLFGAGYWLLKDLYTSIIYEQKDALTDSIIKDVAVFNEILLNAEKEWDAELSRSLPAMANEINERGLLYHLPNFQPNDSGQSLVNQSPRDRARSNIKNQLKALKAKYKVSDIHIINRDLVVVESTFAQEIGLDMTKFSDDYTQYLYELLNKGEFSAHRVSLADVDGSLKKYAYYSPANSGYIINVDIDVKDRLQTQKNNRLTTYLFGEYVNQLETKYSLINNIDLLLISKSNEWSLFKEGRQADPEHARSLYA